MPLGLAEVIVAAVEVYAIAGVLFALTFLPRALARLDTGVAGAPITMRLLILPGVSALWPLFAWRWLRHRHAPVEHNPHRDKASDR